MTADEQRAAFRYLRALALDLARLQRLCSMDGGTFGPVQELRHQAELTSRTVDLVAEVIRIADEVDRKSG